jgi:hypothetical protein
VADSTFPATSFKVYKTTLGLSIHNYLIPILTFGAWKLDLYIAASLCKFGWVEKCRKRLHTQHIANGFLESGRAESIEGFIEDDFAPPPLPLTSCLSFQ